jgi:hypothetical protein
MRGGSREMTTLQARRALSQPLRFGDADQIAAYAHLERVKAIMEVLIGSNSIADIEAVDDAIRQTAAERYRQKGQITSKPS